jgi:hypothetical protein|tara:strand:+ start:4356 stop:4667 length:312 start_codon:yes stop_codon:yes gene_type:complete
MINMMNAVTDFLSSKIVIGTTLTLIGLHQFSGPLPFFNKDQFGSMEFGSLPFFGGVTPLKVLGTIAVGSGLVMLFGKSMIMTPTSFVDMSAEMIEGAKAHGHL